VSIPDGWWDEGYTPDVGWCIGAGESYDDLDYQNRVESQALYDLLEKEIVPLFYDRGRDGLPREWVRRMKAAMQTLAPMFNSNRMVRQYAEQFYAPAGHRWDELTTDELAKSKELAAWTHRVGEQFPVVQIESVTDDVNGTCSVGTPVNVRAQVHLGALPPENVKVQLCFGRLDVDGQLNKSVYMDMEWSGAAEKDGSHAYAAQMSCRQTGTTGYTVRVLPKYGDMIDGRELGLIRWA